MVDILQQENAVLTKKVSEESQLRLQIQKKRCDDQIASWLVQLKEKRLKVQEEKLDVMVKTLMDKCPSDAHLHTWIAELTPEDSDETLREIREIQRMYARRDMVLAMPSNNTFIYHMKSIENTYKLYIGHDYDYDYFHYMPA